MKRICAAIAATGITTQAIALTIGVSPDFPPYEYRASSGELAGYDIDVGNAICKKLGESCRWIPVEYSQIGNQVLSGKLDMVISSFSLKQRQGGPGPGELDVAALFVSSAPLYLDENTREPLGVVVSKDNVALLLRVNGAILHLFKSGELKKMAMRHGLRLEQVPQRQHYTSQVELSMESGSAFSQPQLASPEHPGTTSTRTDVACPTTYKAYAQFTLEFDVRQLHELVWFKYPAGEMVPTTGGADIPIPRLSRPTPLASSNDLYALSNDDWHLVKAANDKSSANWLGHLDRQIQSASSQWEREMLPKTKRSSIAQQADFERIFDCWITRTAHKYTSPAGKQSVGELSGPAATAAFSSVYDGKNETAKNHPEQLAIRQESIERFSQAQSKVQEKVIAEGDGHHFAPYADSKCVRVLFDQKGTIFPTQFMNVCKFPISVLHCTAKPGQVKSQCSDESAAGWGLSGLIRPGKTYPFVRGFSGPWQAMFYVCKMREDDPHQLCILPKHQK